MPALRILVVSDFKALREWLHEVMKVKADGKELVLLNVGTNNHREYHWRFRLPSGEIVNVSAEREE